MHFYARCKDKTSEILKVRLLAEVSLLESNMTKPEPILFTISSEQQADIPENIAPGAAYQIPVEGSLGLLALGAAGILAWRQVRAQESSNTENPKQNEEC